MSIPGAQMLPISQLQPNPLQPRDKIHKEDLSELVESIQSVGILEPLIVAHTPAGYQLIAGERRWRAAQLAGLTEVPVLVKETSPKGMLEMAIVENVQRVDLNPIERGQAFQQLIRDFHYLPSQIAKKIGKSAPFISNSLKLLELPDAVKDGLMGGLITEGHARALGMIVHERAMIECYKQILKEGANVRRAEELARKWKMKMGQRIQDRGYTFQDLPRMDEYASQLQQVFSTKTNVKLTRSERQTKVVIVFKGSPAETDEQLAKIMALTKLKH